MFARSTLCLTFSAPQDWGRVGRSSPICWPQLQKSQCSVRCPAAKVHTTTTTRQYALTKTDIIQIKQQTEKTLCTVIDYLQWTPTDKMSYFTEIHALHHHHALQLDWPQTRCMAEPIQTNLHTRHAWQDRQLSWRSRMWGRHTLTTWLETVESDGVKGNKKIIIRFKVFKFDLGATI